MPHLRTAHLRRAGGWDAFNVTEDADLGLRFARLGLTVGDLASTTKERAERSPRAWFNQRRRWTKGWMQTALVLARRGTARDLGARGSAVVALMMVNLVGGPLLAPVALPLLALHLARAGLPAPHDWLQVGEATLATAVFALGMIVPAWCGYAGCRARGLAAGAALVLVLPYQLMIACAAWGGLIDLVRRPHHWRKTPHTAGGARRGAAAPHSS